MEALRKTHPYNCTLLPLTTPSPCLPHRSFSLLVPALPGSLNYSFSSNFTRAPLLCLYPPSLCLYDLSALFMLSSSYALISMYAVLSITLTNFPSSNCTPALHYWDPKPHPPPQRAFPFLSYSFWNPFHFHFLFFLSHPFSFFSFSHCPRNSTIEGGFY